MKSSRFVTQIVSDLHLGSEILRIPPRAPNLIVAGDISFNADVLFKFFKRCSQDFDQVYFVPGNHEYYSKRGLTTDNFVQNVDRDLEYFFSSFFDNVVFLQKKTVEVSSGVRLMGCTLWTSVPKDFQFQTKVSDFSRIPCFTPKNRNSCYLNHRNWIRDNLRFGLRIF